MEDVCKPVTVAEGRDGRRDRRIARKNPALSGGTTADWLVEFGFVQVNEATPLGVERMEREIPRR